jgi:hypothetical protein
MRADWEGCAKLMSPKLELGLTVGVCVAGILYFCWRAFTAGDDGDQLLYIAFVIVGAIISHRAIRDVLRKLKATESQAAEQPGE